MTLFHTASILMVASLISFQLPATATTYNANVSKTHHSTTTTKTTTATKKSYWSQHPKVKAAATGAGVGTAAGALTGLVTHRGIVRGAAIGAGTGAGVGLIRSSDTMKRHPIFKNTATGGAVGLGLGMAGGRGSHPGLKGAAVGSAVGLGFGLIKDKLK